MANNGEIDVLTLGAARNYTKQSMPSADSSIAGRVVQYVGSSSGAYTSGYFYKCVYDNESDIYVWAVVKYSADTDAALDENSENPVQNKVIKGALDEKQNSTMSVPIEINGTQYTTVESAIGAILALANLKQAKTLDTPVAVDGTNYTTVETALGALAGKTVDVDGSSIIKDEDTGALSAVKATKTTYGIVKPDNDTIRINEDGELEGADQTDLSAYETSWSGTKAEWAALSDTDKVKYVLVSFTDDGDTSEVVDAVSDGDMRAPTANAVYDALFKYKDVSSAIKLSDIVTGGGNAQTAHLYGRWANVTLDIVIGSDATIGSNTLLVEGLPTPPENLVIPIARVDGTLKYAMLTSLGKLIPGYLANKVATGERFNVSVQYIVKEA